MPGQFRIVVAKPGVDGHDSGGKVIARVLRDTGFEFIYTGLHQTPEQIADTTIQEDPDAVGLSCHSGAHMTLFPKVVALAQGSFTSLEHTTTGAALVLELEDGTRYLRLQDLETSNGPDLRVILTDQPHSDDWHVWDDGEVVDLGPLKGNIGSSNYEIPTSVDLGDFVTAVIWCRRFSVGFAVAPLGSSPS